MHTINQLIEDRIQKMEEEILQKKGFLTGDDLAMLGRVEANLRAAAARMKNK